MIRDLTPNEKQLANFMSELSEKCFSAGWMENLEYVLWDAVISGPRNLGQDSITQKDIDVLIEISDKTKSWIMFDDAREEVAIPLDNWKKRFADDILKSPDKVI